MHNEKLAPPTSPRKRRATKPAAVRLTHPQRVVYANAGITKQGLADYMERVATRMLPYVRGRPLTLLRCPDGQAGECFIQRHLKAPHVHTVQGAHGSFCTVDSAQGLVSLVQHGVLELHTWGSHQESVEHPDTLVIDLDPGERVQARDLVRAAQHVRTLLAAQNLRCFVKRTGGRGLHVVAPLQPKAGWEALKTFAHSVAVRLEAEDPLYTTASSKAERAGHIFIDYHRNVRSASAVALYSPRARPDASVALPLAWDDLSVQALAQSTTLAQALALIEQPDPWSDYLSTRQELTSELATL